MPAYDLLSRLSLASTTALLSLTGLAAWSAPVRAAELTFEKDIRPILKTNCFQCHGEEQEIKGKLDVRLRRFLVKGGKSGPAIVPGNVHDSELIDLVTKGEMPKGKKKLTDKEIATLTLWVEQGAKTARPEPEQLGRGYAFTDEERNW